MSANEETRAMIAKARHYREHGYTYADIGAILGVSKNWARALCLETEMARLNAYNRRWVTSGRCPECDGPMTNPRHGVYTRGKAHERCAKCWSDRVAAESFARRVVGETLLCRGCHERKPFDAYPQRMLRRFLERQGGRSPQCTACDTAARVAYRNRHRVPCIECGKPRTGDGKRQGARGSDTGLCLDCYQGRTEAA